VQSLRVGDCMNYSFVDVIVLVWLASQPHAGGS